VKSQTFWEINKFIDDSETNVSKMGGQFKMNAQHLIFYPLSEVEGCLGRCVKRTSKIKVEWLRT